MIFAIHAYEDRYGGLHGIEDWDFAEAESENDEILAEIAEEMCAAIVESYGLEEEYFDDYEDLTEEEEAEILCEHYSWDVIPLPLATSADECRAELNKHNDPEGICERYGGR